MKVILTMTLVVLSAVLAYSQSAQAPDKREKVARTILSETPHRITMTVEMRETANSAWEPYSSQMKEVNGDRWHLIQNTGLKLELIGIGDRSYQKMPDATWKLREQGSGYTGPTVTQVSGTGLGAMSERKDGSKTVVESHQWSSIRLPSDGSVVEMERKTREWYDDSGRLTRVETEHFNFERKKFQRVTEVYEYDPTIKIEAPIN